VTILLPVWRFWRFRVIQTVGKGAIMMSSVVGHPKRLVKFGNNLRHVVAGTKCY